MLYLLYAPGNFETVEAEIIPLLENKEYELVEYPYNSSFRPQEGAVLLLYLSDEHLREVLPTAGEKDWAVGILPHPENVFTLVGLGLTGKTEKIIKEVTEDPKSQKLDLLCCNGQPVFQSVNIGDIFILTEKNNNNSFLSQVYNIVKNIRRASSLKHHSYQLSADGEKILHTSGLGIVVVEHASSSLISKRLVEDTSINDGNFHAFILAPQNLLVLLVFFLQSLVPRKKLLPRLPSFMGSLMISNLKITNAAAIDYTIDGEKYSAEELIFEVREKALSIKQESTHEKGNTKKKGKKSLKVEGLPTGETREELIKRTLPILPRASTEQFQDLFKVLRENAKVSTPFMVMMILSTLISTFGLFGDSTPVIIGAMILAPIISPIVSFSMGMVRYDVSMLKSGMVTILAGTLVSLVFAAGVSLVIPLKIVTSEISDRLSPTLLDLGIAVASGIAAAYAHAEEGIAKSLAGVAIAVALVPPLSVAGIGLGWWDWNVFSGAFLLYLTNLAGIILFAGFTFLFLGFAPFKRAKMGLIYTSLIVMLLTIPLTLSFNRIQQESTITRALEGTTIDNVVLRDVRLRFRDPIVVSLRLVGPEDITKEDIESIKNEIEELIGQEVVLEVVSAIEF